jgi:beta-lactam-binding protein with PASTA domain
VVTDPKSAAPKGEVDRMSPAPGRYPPGQQVTLYASAGGVVVPNVINQTQVEAAAILQQDGFTVQTDYIPAPSDQVVEAGTVYSESPAAGASEPRGALIQIYAEPGTTATPTASTGNGFGNGNGGFF